MTVQRLTDVNVPAAVGQVHVDKTGPAELRRQTHGRTEVKVHKVGFK